MAKPPFSKAPTNYDILDIFSTLESPLQDFYFLLCLRFIIYLYIFYILINILSGFAKPNLKTRVLRKFQFVYGDQIINQMDNEDIKELEKTMKNTITNAMKETPSQTSTGVKRSVCNSFRVRGELSQIETQTETCIEDFSSAYSERSERTERSSLNTHRTRNQKGNLEKKKGNGNSFTSGEVSKRGNNHAKAKNRHGYSSISASKTIKFDLSRNEYYEPESKKDNLRESQSRDREYREIEEKLNYPFRPFQSLKESEENASPTSLLKDFLIDMHEVDDEENSSAMHQSQKTSDQGQGKLTQPQLQLDFELDRGSKQVLELSQIDHQVANRSEGEDGVSKLSNLSATNLTLSQSTV